MNSVAQKKYFCIPTKTRLPPNGQLLSIVALLVVILAFSYTGPDYTPPSNGLFGFSFKPLEGKHSPAPCSNIPDYSISNSWWTSGSRQALLHSHWYLYVCVLFAIKAPPFAVFALPFTAQIHFDKVTWLHRLSGWSDLASFFQSCCTMKHPAVQGPTNGHGNDSLLSCVATQRIRIWIVSGLWVSHVYFVILIVQ